MVVVAGGGLVPSQLPAGEGFMAGLDAGASVPPYGPGLDGGEPRGRGGGGPGGRDPAEQTGGQAPP